MKRPSNGKETTAPGRWTTLQLGSREHYAIPAALAEAGALEQCLTDVWIGEEWAPLLTRRFASAAARRSDRLDDHLVRSNSFGRLILDISFKATGAKGWKAVLRRNEWFGKWCTRELRGNEGGPLFSYSYTARRPFMQAKMREVKCILGQIDPGPREEELVLEATARYRHLAPPADRAPQKYWDLWREEIAMADKIIVNSPWSVKLLVEGGVTAAKLVEVPLVYETRGTVEHGPDGVASPSQAQRPEPRRRKRLQALFLGSVILRKGVGQLFDAIKMLKREPVDFTFAGPIGVQIPDEISQLSNVRFFGPVDKATTERLYRESDVFLFPTLSDGFGLTQLEALGHGLPVIASTHCGQVVEDRMNGLVLEAVRPEAIAEGVVQLLRDSDLLPRLKSNARVPDECHPKHLAPALLALN